MFDQIIESDSYIFRLAASFLVLAGAMAHSAKVYAQGDESRLKERARGAKYHLVVHSASAQRVRVKHQRNTARLITRLLQNRFEATVWSGYEKISSRIHKFRFQRL